MNIVELIIEYYLSNGFEFIGPRWTDLDSNNSNLPLRISFDKKIMSICLDKFLYKLDPGSEYILIESCGFCEYEYQVQKSLECAINVVPCRYNGERDVALKYGLGYTNILNYNNQDFFEILDKYINEELSND